MQVGDLVKFYPGLLDETMYDKLGIVMEIDEEDGIVIVKFPDYPPQHELEFALEVVSESR
tara:strand:+ start:65 stop:244 length:180 start_codon:yes stop_codon:yes gene_type:complete